MIDIYLCEDNEIHLNKIKTMIENFLQMHPFHERLYFYGKNPHDLLHFINEHHENTGLYFLDIEFPNAPSGLELGKKIRTIDPRAYIVFITAHTEMAYMTMEYHLEALNYIPKLEWHIVRDKIFYCMQTAHERQLKTEASKEEGSSLITVTINKQPVSFNSSDIIAIQTCPEPHRLSLITINGTINIYGSIRDWCSKLNSTTFFRCSSSEIINLSHINKVDYTLKLIELDYGITCKLTKRFSKSLKQLFS